MNKKCKKCEIDKSIEEFGYSKTNRGNRNTRCNPCMAAIKKNERLARLSEGALYKCSSCLNEFVSDDFRIKHNKCKGCLRKSECVDCKKRLAKRYIDIETKKCVDCCSTKKCSKCGITKDKTEYYSRKQSKDKLDCKCKDCVRQYKNKREREHLNTKLARTLRKRLRFILKGKTKGGSAVKLLECSIEELRSYLESKFQPGMTWENWGLHGWHIDHIVPLSSFDLTDPDQCKIAFNYTNLQPLWAMDNWKKNDKV